MLIIIITNRELAERKAQFAQEISNANMQMDNMKKSAEEYLARAEEAENYQRMVQNELAEAKIVQKYNAQLHKDLHREQQARKKLHNDMEDLKGFFFFPFDYFCLDILDVPSCRENSCVCSCSSLFSIGT